LVPLPTAADDHQSKNAARFAETGAAITFDQRKASAQDLAAALTELARDRGRCTAMSAAMRGLSRPRAAQDIADSLETIVGKA
jgi:UDP-N-acetylglucosamine--N-acetylmuramyl-(pentapeptide) pyrophosphoryl-undecaprenol N-acetylglucosamine transferase